MSLWSRVGLRMSPFQPGRAGAGRTVPGSARAWRDDYADVIGAIWRKLAN